MTINIAVVAENKFHKQIKSFFETFEKKHQIEFNKFFFDDEKTFLKQKNHNFNLTFLIHSIKTPSMFKLAEKIKETEPINKVLFTSSNYEFAIKGYKIGLDFYLTHPFDYEEFDFAINKLINDFKKKPKHILINSNWQKIPIEISKIQFAEKIGHNVVIHTLEKNFSTRSTLTNFMTNFKNLPNFIHCVRGAIVNFEWVQSLESQNFLMKTGERISIRRNDRKKIKQLYNNFLTHKNIENSK